MAATDKLIISELDFDQIKANLKLYLQSQDEFSDYDFDGSGMSILLDVLAYNTYYGSYYDNVVANESRLHSAILRDSIVSKAKELSYVPYSRTAPYVLLDLKLTPPNPDDQYWVDQQTVEVPAGTVFSTTVDGKNFDYTTTESFYLEKSGNDYITPIVEGEPQYVKAYEGKLKFASFVVDNSDYDRKYQIPVVGVDTKRMRVWVKPNINSGIESQVEFYHASTFPIPDSENNAYWIWENNDLQYELEFGDGVLGKKLKDGNVIIVQYLVTNGSLTNGCTTFRTSSSIAGVRGIGVTAVGKSVGGAEEESLESIKFSAPKAYSMQNRAVTDDDYKFLVKQLFPAAKSINVWGGQDNNPPQYGYVYLSIYPELTEEQNDDLINTIKDYNMITINPVIVQPDFIYLVVDTTVIYDKKLTLASDANIISAVSQTIDEFSQNNIEKFGTNFRYSQLVSEIDDSEPSIVSNLTYVNLQKRFTPNLDVLEQYILDYKDELTPASFSIEGFTVYEPVTYVDATYKAVDDGAGKINIIRIRPDKADVIVSQCGIIDYVAGVVTLSDFLPLTVEDEELRANVKPKDPDVVTNQNTVLKIEDYTITVKQGNN